METTLISPQAVRELLLASGWTEHPEHRVFTQFLDLELSPKFWDLARPLPSDDCKFDRLAREMGIPRDTLIEDLLGRTQRLLDEILDPPKAPKPNSEKIIWPEALLKKAQTPNGPEEPKPKPIQISSKEIEWWLHRNGWVEASFGERTCWVQRYRTIDEFQSILAHLQRFHGPYVTTEDVTEFLHPKIEIPDDLIDIDAPYLEILSRQTKTPLDQLITALRERTENTEHHG